MKAKNIVGVNVIRPFSLPPERAFYFIDTACAPCLNGT